MTFQSNPGPLESPKLLDRFVLGIELRLLLFGSGGAIVMEVINAAISIGMLNSGVLMGSWVWLVIRYVAYGSVLGFFACGRDPGRVAVVGALLGTGGMVATLMVLASTFSISLFLMVLIGAFVAYGAALKSEDIAYASR